MKKKTIIISSILSSLALSLGILVPVLQHDNLFRKAKGDTTATINLKANIQTYAASWEKDNSWSWPYNGKGTFYERIIQSSDFSDSMVDSTMEITSYNGSGGGISYNGNWDVAIHNAKVVWQLNDYSKYISAFKLEIPYYGYNDLIVNLYYERSGTTSIATSNTGAFDITNTSEEVNSITLIDTHTTTSAYGYTNLTYTISSVSTVEQEATFFCEAFVREFVGNQSDSMWSTFESRYSNITDARSTLQAIEANEMGTIQEQAMYAYDTYLASNPSCNNYLGRSAGGSSESSSSEEPPSSEPSSSEESSSEEPIPENDGLMTKIVLDDRVGWCFRTLWLDSFSYADGYSQDLRNSFISTYYENNISSWAKEGTTKGYHYHNNGVNLCAGGNSRIYTFYLPAWITDFTIQVENSGHSFLFGSSTSLYETLTLVNGDDRQMTYSGNVGSCIGKTLTITMYQNGWIIGKAAIGSTPTYSTEVTVNRYYLSSTEETLKPSSSLINHQYYLPAFGSIPTVSGYSKDSDSWYSGTTYAGATSTYDTSSLITSTDNNTINIVAKYQQIAAGFYGGETFYGIDEYGRYGNPNYLRIYLLDENNNGVLSDVFSTTSVTTYSGHNVYRITIPEYDGTSDYGWIKFIVLEYTSNTDTEINWNNRKYQSSDLAASFWKGYKSWWIKDTTGGGTINMGYENTSALNGLESGKTYYLEIMDNSWDVSKNKAIYFHTPLDTSSSDSSAWALCRKVEGITSGFGYGLYEFTAPLTSTSQYVTWNKFIVVQLKSGTTLDWDNKDKQSPNEGGYIVSGVDNTVKSNGGDMYSITYEQRLGFFDTFFNNTIGTTCQSDGSTDIETLKSNWSAVSNQLPMDSNIADLFKTETANESGTANQQAAARYDYVYHKYHSSYPDDITDFAERTDTINGGGYSYSAVKGFSPLQSLFGSDPESTLTTIVIIVASGVALLAITTLTVILVKKRKEIK